MNKKKEKDFTPQHSIGKIRGLDFRKKLSLFLICYVHLPSVFSRGHATLHLGLSVGLYVDPKYFWILSVWTVFALSHLPNRQRLSCRVSSTCILLHLSSVLTSMVTPPVLYLYVVSLHHFSSYVVLSDMYSLLERNNHQCKPWRKSCLAIWHTA